MWTWTLVIGALTLALYLYHRKKRREFEDYGVPVPFELPFIGSYGASLFRGLHITEFTKELYNFKKEAKYIGVHFLKDPVVVVRDIDVIKTVLIKEFDHFSDHQNNLDETTDPLFTKNLIVLNGEKWHEVRSLLSPAFTASKMKAMYELMLNCANNFIKNFIEQFGNVEAVDMKDAFAKYTSDVIATCAFGIEVDSMKDPTNEFYVSGKEISNNQQISRLLKMFFIYFFPRLSKALNMKIMPDKMTKFFIDVIGTTVKTRDEKGISRPDMLQLMMNARGKTSENVKLDVVEMTAQASFFFFAGFDTASSHMSLMAHEIAVNPDIQKRLQIEIDEISTKNKGKVTYEEISSMPYLEAVFQETLRKHPQLAFLNRICTKPYELPPTLPGAKPYVVKPKTEMIIPVVGIHKDPAYFDEPEKFNPDRFLDKKTYGDITSLGFGSGPRMCIGNRFAILETKVLFFHLLQKCSLHPCSKTCVPLKYSAKQLGPTPKDGFWLKIKERS